jgi:photosystem II stability/assembly factor-like uncharacterized protein
MFSINSALLKTVQYIALCALTLSPAYAQWKSVASGTDQDIYDIMMLPTSTTGFASGGRGILLRTTNNGRAWNPINSGTTQTISAIDAISSTVIFSATLQGSLQKTMDAGQSWQKLLNDTPLEWRDIAHFNENVILGTGLDNAVHANLMRSTNGGENWAKIDFPAPDGPHLIRKIQIIDSRHAVMFGSENYEVWNEGDPIVYFTADTGKTWQNISPANAISFNAFTIYAKSDQEFILAGTSRIDGAIAVYTTTNRGYSWTVETTNITGLPVQVYDIQKPIICAFVHDSEYGTSQTAVIAKDQNGEWELVPAGTPILMRAAFIAGARQIIMVGNSGEILISNPDCSQPRVAVQPEKIITLPLGASLLLQCAPQTQGNSFQWYHYDQLIPGQNSPDLLINNVIEENAGIYQVRITNQCGSSMMSHASNVMISSQGNPAITLAQTEVNLGSVKTGSKKNMRIANAITNTGTGILRINSIQFDGNNARYYALKDMPAFPLELRPGNSIPLTIEFMPETEGDHYAVLQIVSDQNVIEASILVQGNGSASAVPARQLALQTSGYTFLSTPVISGSRSQQLFLLRNTGTIAVQIDSAKIEGNQDKHFSISRVQALPFTLQPDSNMALTITYNPKSTGMHTAALHISAGQDEFIISLNRTGAAGGGFILGRVAIGAALDTVYEWSHQIVNNRIVKNITMSNPAYTILSTEPALPAEIAFGEKLKVNVRFAPQQQGWNSGAMIFTIRDVENNDEYIKRIPITGKGEITSSVKEQDEKALYIYQNSPEKIRVNMHVNKSGFYQSTIRDIMGTTLRTTTEFLNEGTYTQNISVQNLPAGIYFLDYSGCGEYHSESFIRN